jgi:hypothetical protein
MSAENKLPLYLLAMMLALVSSHTANSQTSKDREFQECRDCPKMVGIPAGKFLMAALKANADALILKGPNMSYQLRRLP